MINKKELYENIMKDISKIIKKSLNEYSSYEDDYEDYDPLFDDYEYDEEMMNYLWNELTLMGYKEGDRISEDIVYDILSETDYSITDEEWTMFAAEHNIKFYSDDNSGKQFFE